MKTTMALLGGLVLVAACVAATLILYSSMPAKVPIHWNVAGEIDGWSSKSTGAFAVPFGMAVLLLFMWAAPWLSPKNFKVEPFQGVFNYLMLVVVAMFAFIHGIVLASATHPGANYSRMMIGGMFVFFGLVGNLLGKVRRNFWMGIRTPWTLASDEVWTATHRLAGRLLFATGMVGAVLIWVGVIPPAAALILLLASLFVPAVYSLLLSKRRESATGSD